METAAIKPAPSALPPPCDETRFPQVQLLCDEVPLTIKLLAGQVFIKTDLLPPKAFAATAKGMLVIWSAELQTPMLACGIACLYVLKICKDVALAATSRLLQHVGLRPNTVISADVMFSPRPA